MKIPRVLIIDDEEELVTTFVERLSMRGIDAEAVTDGHEALERISRTPYNVIVADLKMPGLGGMEVVEILRERYPQVRIILITGHGSVDEERIDAIEGVDRILMKPFSIGDLVDGIRESLAREDRP